MEGKVGEPEMAKHVEKMLQQMQVMPSF